MLSLEPDLLRKLERVTLNGRWQIAGQAPGATRSSRHGSSPEFADFRTYVEGDDLRRVDWNAYARLGQLFLRLHAGEEISTLTLLLDRSRSMHTGGPPKSYAAARIAAALAYIALRGHDRVVVAGWTEEVDWTTAPLSGVRSLRTIWESIEYIMQSPGKGTDFDALRRYQPAGSGSVVVVSDFLSDTDITRSLRSLAARGDRVTALQVLAPDELEPDFRGDWQLVDVESERALDVTVGPRSLQRYQSTLRQHTEGLKDACRRLGVAYVRLSSNASLSDELVPALLAGRVVS